MVHYTEWDREKDEKAKKKPNKKPNKKANNKPNNTSKMSTMRNLTPIRNGSATVPTRGKQVSIPFQPNSLIFNDGNRSWMFTRDETSPLSAEYSGSDGKVGFKVFWSPDHTTTHSELNFLYYDTPRASGEIGGKAVLQGLKAFSRHINVFNMSYIPMQNGGKLRRSILPNKYNIYKGFMPRYDSVNYYKDLRALVAAMLDTTKLSLNELQELAPSVDREILKVFQPYVGTQANLETIDKAIRDSRIHIHYVYRTWTAQPPPNGRKRNREDHDNKKTGASKSTRAALGYQANPNRRPKNSISTEANFYNASQNVN